MANKREHHHVFFSSLKAPHLKGVAKGPGCRRTEAKAQCSLERLFEVCRRCGKGRVESAAGVEAPNCFREPKQVTATLVVDLAKAV